MIVWARLVRVTAHESGEQGQSDNAGVRESQSGFSLFN